MHKAIFVAAVVAAALPVHHVSAQATLNVPTGGTSPAPVPQAPPAPADDNAEAIARDAARDLRDSRFYNRPGATRADYDRDWQECRLIARGSRTPSGSVPFFYNPAVISPIAAGVAGGIFGAIAGAVAEGQQRRENRRNCLLIRGWRLVEVPPAQAERVRAMTDEQRSAYFDSIVGAAQVEGKITERTSFAIAPDAATNLEAPVAVPGAVFLGRRVDPAVPVALAPGEGAIVFAFRRPDATSAGRAGAVQFVRYDVEQRDLIYQPRDWRRRGDTTTYRMHANSRDRRAPLEVHVLKVTAGDYVVAGSASGTPAVTNSFCFGAPTFRVGAGEIVYVGDFVPLVNAQVSGGQSLTALAYASHIEDARRTLAVQQPALAQALAPATLRNRATFACSGIEMDRWDVAGAEALPQAEPRPAPQTTAAAGSN